MRVDTLHRILSGLMVMGPRRIRVCIDKPTFHSALEQDGCVILDVESARVELVPLMDGDGFAALRKDGTEKHFQALLLRGGHQ